MSLLYSHAHNSLLSLFRSKLKAGARLPTQMELSRHCGTGQSTIHRLLQSIEKEGLIRRTGRGFELVRRPAQKDFLPPPSTLTRREAIEDSLLSMLVRGELKPGQKFSELALARKYCVTTGTIREALLHLARIGVFSKTARRQWSVVKLSEKFINDLMDIRILLETYALRRYFEDKQDWKKDFSRLYQENKALTGTNRKNHKEFFRLDGELHQTIMKSGHNEYLMENFLYVSFPIQVQFLDHKFDYSFMKTGLAQHMALLEAILEDKSREAIARLKGHLEAARATLLDFCDGGSSHEG